MRVTGICRDNDHVYLSVDYEGEEQCYRLDGSSGEVQRRFGLSHRPHWARVHPGRAEAVLAALSEGGLA